MLTNINCSKTCVYQEDGKCCFNSTSSVVVATTEECVYFAPKPTAE